MHELSDVLGSGPSSSTNNISSRSSPSQPSSSSDDIFGAEFTEGPEYNAPVTIRPSQRLKLKAEKELVEAGIRAREEYDKLRGAREMHKRINYACTEPQIKRVA